MMFLMQMDKGKEVVPPLVKDKEVLPPLMDVLVHDHPKRRNYGHFHEVAGPTHFFQMIFTSKLEAMSLSLDFRKHFSTMPTVFSLKTEDEQRLLMKDDDEHNRPQGHP
ncbi:hypothetical protein D1007_12678 [Hordeum vulgare]|nr:hypothetical protein D1007_12678 [Hordeum vulgare]